MSTARDKPAKEWARRQLKETQSTTKKQMEDNKKPKGDLEGDIEEGGVAGSELAYKPTPLDIGWCQPLEDGEGYELTRPGVGSVFFKNITWDPGYCIGCFGARGSGKSYFLRYWLWLICTYYPVVYVFTETKMNCFWAGYINDHFIFQGYREDKLLKILEHQKARVRAFRDGAMINPYCLIIWDDCLPKDLEYDPLFKQIFFNGRHYCIGNFMNTQYFYAIPKKYRGNLDWVVSMKQNQSAQMEGFFQEMSYAGKGFDKFNQFLAMFTECTQENQVIVFDVRDQTKLPIEKIYLAKAEDPGIFWVGDEIYWSKNQKQLQEIMSGKMKEKLERKVDWSKFGIVNIWESGLQASNTVQKKKGKEEEKGGRNQPSQGPQKK